MQHSGMQHPHLSIVRQSLADGVYEVMRERILTGMLPAGERLLEPLLAAELGVSRTPVREALRRLEQEGLVRRNPRDLGRYVLGLSADEVREIIGIRSVLEGYAARLAAQRITDEELSSLRALHEAASKVIGRADVARLVELNTSFHDGIIAASRAPRCAALIEALRGWILRYRLEFLRSDDLRRQSFSEHRDILSALGRRDPELAEDVVRRHIAQIAEALADAPGREGDAQRARQSQEAASSPSLM